MATQSPFNIFARKESLLMIIRQNSKGEDCLVPHEPHGPVKMKYGYCTTRVSGTPIECPWCNQFRWTFHQPFQFDSGDVCAECYYLVKDASRENEKPVSEALNAKTEEMLIRIEAQKEIAV